MADPISSPEMGGAAYGGDDVPAVPQAPTFISQYQDNHPELANTDPIVVARNLYDSGAHMDNESFPAFASRVGVTQSPLETAMNSGLSSAAMHLNEPLEAALAGIGNKTGLNGAPVGDGGFMDGYAAKRQELNDQSDVGSYENPKSNLLGNTAGTAAAFTKIPSLVGSNVPLLSKLAESGPLGNSILKMIGLGEVTQAPRTIEDQAINGFDPVKAAKDLGLTAAEGTGEALGGGVISKTLGAVAPLLKAFGGALSSGDTTLQSMPRTFYSRGLQRMGAGFTGDQAPLAAAHDIDAKFYNDTLDEAAQKGSINVDKAVSDLNDMMANKPGYTSRVMNAAHDALPDDGSADFPAPGEEFDPDKVAKALAERAATGGDRTGSIDPSEFENPHDMGPASGVFTKVLNNLDEGDTGSVVDDGQRALSTMVERLKASDPSGQTARQYIADIYKSLIPQRLSGSFDTAADYNRNAMTGALSDTGKLINPPLTGLPGLAAAFYERKGGGPGAMLQSPLAVSAPKATLAGGATAVAALGSGGIGLPTAALLKGAGGVSGALGAPGAAIDSAANGAGFGDIIGKGLNNSLPNPYQSILGGAGNQSTPSNEPLFPDHYTPPPAPQQHTEMEPSQVHDFLSNGQPQQVASFIGAKLGPQVSQQMADAGPESQGAAMFSLMSQPQYRKQLLG